MDIDTPASGEERITKSVKLKDFCEDCCLELIVGNEQNFITFGSALINRPGLLFAGFDDYFGEERVQIIGNAENYYWVSLDEKQKEASMERLFSRPVPCVIFARGIIPPVSVCEIASRHNVPLMFSNKTTTALNNDLANYLERLLAPSTMLHGTLLDISGIGVLITGHSGLGKSEAALELIHRGHRLVADDAVIVSKIEDSVVGTAPESIKFFMEVRGIGLIDVRSMYGVGAVLEDEKIDLVVELVTWADNMPYDRLGSNEQKEGILGVQVPKLIIPVMPGRNLAVVVEVAAKNLRLKSFGIDAVRSLVQRAKLKS